LLARGPMVTIPKYGSYRQSPLSGKVHLDQVDLRSSFSSPMRGGLFECADFDR
jgi:hypothetical protein